MKRCELCTIEFPEHLIEGLVLGDRVVPDCCPICALEEINEAHGLPYGTPFGGEQARRNHDEANVFLGDPRGYEVADVSKE